jgi:hypothetical protein
MLSYECKLIGDCSNVKKFDYTYFDENFSIIKIKYYIIENFNYKLPDKLKILDMEGCRLRYFNAELPKKLRYLIIIHNFNLNKFDKKLPKDLYELNLNNNNLTSFTQKLPKKLHTIELSNNGLTIFNQKIPKSVKIINLYNNDLYYFKSKISLSNLKILRLRDNRLTKFDLELPNTIIELRIEYNTLRKFNTILPKSLIILDLYRNNLKKLKLNKIPSEWFRYDANIKNKKTFVKEVFYKSC